jgi:uncharacterized protein (TIGR03083 family)
MGVNRDDFDHFDHFDGVDDVNDVNDLLAAWALDAIDDRERDAVEAVLAVDPDRARVARTLQHTVAAIGDAVAEPPPPHARANLLRAVAARGRDPLEPTPALPLFERQVASMTELLVDLGETEWQHPVAPYRWSVHGLVAHLLVIERYMANLVGLDVAPVGGAVDDHLEMGASLIASELAGSFRRTFAAWNAQATDTIATIRSRPDALGDQVVFHGWPVSVETLLVARAFEVWTHADDIRRATVRPMQTPLPRDLRAMSMFSIATLPLLVPAESVTGPARIVLTGPGGGTFDLDGPGEERAVTLVVDIVDYCRTAARRIDIDELPALIEGDRQQAHALLTAARVLAV